MSGDELERAVQALSAPDFQRFSAWFEEWRSAQWDRQIEQDAITGGLDHLADAALAEFRAGHFTQLPVCRVKKPAVDGDSGKDAPKKTPDVERASTSKIERAEKPDAKSADPAPAPVPAAS